MKKIIMQGKCCKLITHKIKIMITSHKEYIEIKLQDTNNNWYLYSSSSATQRFPTHWTYASAQCKFREFCQQLGNLHLLGSPCPANDWTLCLFATFLAQSVHHSNHQGVFVRCSGSPCEANPLTNPLRL